MYGKYGNHFAVVLLVLSTALAGAGPQSETIAATAATESAAPMVQSVGQWPTVSAYQQETGNRIASFNEAPMLRELVAAGTLPSVDERLPEQPAVVEPLERVGDYGGTWRRVATRPTDNRLADRVGYEPLARFARDASGVVPGIASAWEVSDSGRRYVFSLREGMKWSDGAPFSADDMLFQYQDIYGNEELSPSFPSWLTVSGQPVQVRKLDDFTVAFEFAQPYGLFLENMAHSGRTAIAPQHYLRQFHPGYTDRAKVDQTAKAEGYDTWYALFGQRNNVGLNPDLPSIRSWKLVTEASGVARQVAERNPYYWKVDTAGNQLPYIDRVTYDMVESAEIANFKAMAGEIDMHSRYMNFSNYTLFQENAAKGDYRVFLWKNPTPGVVNLNLSNEDPVVRQLFHERDFRMALSYALDREEIAQLVYLGLGEPWNGLAFEEDPHYVPPKHIEHDPSRANQLLDGIGLTARDADGYRLGPDGKPFTLIIESYGAEEAGGAADEPVLVKDHWENVGIRTAIKIEDRSLWTARRAGNSMMANIYLTDSVHWAVAPVYFVPLANNSGWGSGWAEWYTTGGASGEEPIPGVRRLMELYDEMKITVDPDERAEIGRQLMQSHVDNVWIIGTVRYPALAIVKNNFRNVPENGMQSWPLLAPGYLNPEQFFIQQAASQ